MFINALSHLFPRTSTQFLRGKSKPTIKITLSFPNFLQLHFEDYAFYQLFGDRSDATTSLILELTSNGQITFAPIAFDQLKVDRMVIHCSSLEPYSFEEIFNNTNIGDLTMEGKRLSFGRWRKTESWFFPLLLQAWHLEVTTLSKLSSMERSKPRNSRRWSNWSRARSFLIILSEPWRLKRTKPDEWIPRRLSTIEICTDFIWFGRNSSSIIDRSMDFNIWPISKASNSTRKISKVRDIFFVEVVFDRSCGFA